MTALPPWARAVVRKAAALGIVCGVYASAMWYYVQDVPGLALAAAALTALLAGLLIYNESRGRTPLYP